MDPRPLEGLEGEPSVLVLLAAYNGDPFITEQIDSILAQTGVKVTLLISNDHSTDDTAQKIQPFLRDNRVRTISPPQRMGSAAKNFFWMIGQISSEKYHFVSFSDQDDVWEDAKLSRAGAILRSSGAAGYSCTTTAFWPDGREKILGHQSRLTRSDFLFESAGQGCTYVLTADFYERVRTFITQHPDTLQGIHFHDWAIYVLSRCWRESWVFDPRPMMRYRQHQANDTGARSGIAGALFRIKKIGNGWYAEQIRLLTAICVAAIPSHEPYRRWQQLFEAPRGLRRSIRIAYFCFRGGRRRGVDNVVLIVSALAGWV